MTAADRTLAIQPLLMQGLSASKIAKALDASSRSAVLGHIYRNKLENPRARGSMNAQIRYAKERSSAETKLRRANEKARRKTGPKPTLASLKWGAGTIWPPAPASEPVRTREGAWLALPGSNPRPLAEIAAGECKWTIGDPFSDGPSLFCGCIVSENTPDCDHHKALENTPYCDHHKALAYAPRPVLAKKLKRAA